MKKIAMIIMAGIMISCTKENDCVLPAIPENGVFATADDFTMAQTDTKISISQSGDDAPSFSWKEGDVIGIIPMGGETVQSNYMVKEVGSDPRGAAFDGGDWALKADKSYAAYYPYKEEVARRDDQLTISFLGQMQNGNDNLDHIGEYDYMYASAVNPKDDVAMLSFHHKVSLLNLRLDLPEGIFNKIVLSSEDGWFAESAQLSLADGTISVVPSSMSKEATLVLNDISVSSASPMSVWISVLPTAAMSGKTLTVEAYTEDFVHTGSIDVSAAFDAGKAYRYEAKLDNVSRISVAQWEYPLSDSFKTATSIEISVKQTKPVSGFTNLNQDGTFWAVMSGSVLKLQSSCSIILGHDCFNRNSGRGLFSDFSRVKSITGLENLDMKDVRDMYEMFGDCKSLTSLDLSSWDTSNAMDMSLMFYSCCSLVSLDLSGFDTSNVTAMGAMFWFCESLKSVDLSGFNTSNVKDMSKMFFGFGGEDEITSLDLSTWDTSNVTSMREMFGQFRPRLLTYIDLSGWDTSSVTDMESMFEECTLTNINLSGWNTSSVTKMNSMFKNCSSLTNLELSIGGTSDETSMASMFRECSSLVSIDLSGWNTSNVTDMSGMFSGCSSLTSLDLSGWDTSNVTSMGSMFSGCISLTSLDLSGLDTSNVTYMGSMFSDDTSLANLNLSGWDTSNVTSMGSMFSGCDALVSIDLSGWDISNVTDMRYLFRNCASLTSLDLSEWDTSKVIYMDYVFTGCSSLSSLDLSGWDTSRVNQMYSMFADCSSLTRLVVSNKFKIPYTGYGWGLFLNTGGADGHKCIVSGVTDVSIKSRMMNSNNYWDDSRMAFAD